MSSRSTIQRFMHKLCLFLHAVNRLEQGETAHMHQKLHSGKFKLGLIPSFQSKKLIRLHEISFQQCTSHFTARAILFV